MATTTSKLEKKLGKRNEELKELQRKALLAKKNHTEKRTLAALHKWKRKKVKLVKQIQQSMIPLLSNCYDGLHLLDELYSSDLKERHEKVLDSVLHPFDASRIQFDGRELGESGHEFEKPTSELVLKKRQLTRTILRSKALIGEIKQDLERSARSTLLEFLQVEEYYRYFPFEWSGMYDLRKRTVETAILVSKRMAQFMCNLSRSDRLLNLLRSKITSIALIQTTNCIMANRFLTLIEKAEYEISATKLKRHMPLNSADEEDLFEKVITRFFWAVIDLEWIMSFTIVPVKRSFVNGARLKLEGVLGYLLYVMQGIKLQIRKQNCRYWTRMKKFIPELWRDLETLSLKPEVVVREARTQQIEEEEEEETKMALMLMRRRRRSTRPEIEEGIGASGTKNDKQACESSGTKDDNNDKQVSESSGKKDEGEIVDDTDDTSEQDSDSSGTIDEEEAGKMKDKGKQIVEENVDEEEAGNRKKDKGKQIVEDNDDDDDDDDDDDESVVTLGSFLFGGKR